MIKCIANSFFVVVTIAFFVQVANGLERITCRGGLRIFVAKGENEKTATPVELIEKSYSATSDDFDRFSVGLDSARAFVTVWPWNGIHHKSFPDRYNKDFEVSVDTDKKNRIQIKLKGLRSQHTEHVICKIATGHAEEKLGR